MRMGWRAVTHHRTSEKNHDQQQQQQQQQDDDIFYDKYDSAVVAAAISLRFFSAVRFRVNSNMLVFVYDTRRVQFLIGILSCVKR